MSAMEDSGILLDVQDLSVEYASPGTTPVTAVESVSFSLLAASSSSSSGSPGRASRPWASR